MPHPTRYRPAHLALAALAGGGAALALYAALIEPRRVKLRRARIHHRGLAPDLEGFRIAVLSDFHGGRLTPASAIHRAVRVACDARPDLVALTGDFVDRSADDLEPVLDALSGITAPFGVYAVPGNHDREFVGLEHWHGAVARYPMIHDVTNRYEIVDVGETRLCVAGIDDLERGLPRLQLPEPHARDLTILLAHNPDQAERTRRAVDAVDLILSGHTHGGQIRLPSVGPLHRKSEIYDQGLRRRPWTQVFTTRGIGTTALPIRLGAPPEVALLELTGEPREEW